MKGKYLLFFLLLGSSVYSQKEFNNWYFGYHSAITFNSGIPVPLPPNSLFQNAGFHGCSVSDSNGVFLFTSNTYNIYNRNLMVMAGGSSIMAGEGNSQSIAVKQPGNDSLYYLFYVSDIMTYGVVTGLRYSIINIKLNGGLGGVNLATKNICPYLGDSCTVHLTATRHHNNRDIWIISVRYGKPNTYLAYLLTSSGLDTIPVISQTPLSKPIFKQLTNQPIRGYLKISQDGKFLIRCDSVQEFCLFNTRTGVVSPKFTFTINLPNQPVGYAGKEFSRDSKYVYFTRYPDNKLLQYDANSPDSATFVQSGIIIGDRARQNIQLAPDGKIYVGVVGDYPQPNDSLNVINNPSFQGTGCNYIKNIIAIPDHNTCIPQFVQRYKAYQSHSGNCANSPVRFSSDIWPPADTIRWNFGDPASGVNNISGLANPSHVFSAPGTYTIELYVRHNDNRTDTTWNTITILPSPVVILGSDRSICAGDSVTFDAGACSGCTFEWKDLTTSAVVGNSQTYTATTQGNYEVTVTNSNGCAGKDTVQVSFSPPPQITNSPLSKSICSGESTNITLTSTVANTLFYWTASISSGSVSGFSADSGTVINQILSGSGVVNYHIIPKIGNCIGNAVDFPVTVTPGDSVKVSIIPSDNNICTGASVIFTATPTGTGTLTYDWKVNGTSQGVNSSTFNYTPANGDVVTCVLSSSVTTCISNNPATSNSVTMVVNPLQPVTVGVTPSANNICQGASVTFTANTTPAGGTKHYQWKVNNISAGTDNPVFTYVPANGDAVTCDLSVSGLSCITAGLVTSLPVNMVVNPNVNLAVSITASANPVCSGIPVTFTATPPPGGTATYQWKVNSIISGLNQNTFSYVPVNNDVVECGLSIAGMACLQNNPATSNTITMGITAAPLVTFPACFDTITTTTAKPIHLKGAIPYGGTYSGPGVNSATGIFTPSLAGTGSKAITYTYTNAGLCSSFKVKNIIVQPPAAFSCGNNFTDIRDNKSYKTIQIGSQCWMAEDLNFGTAIPQTTHQRDNCIAEKYAVSVPPPFGGGQEGAYQWDEVMDYTAIPGEKGLCPPSWHIPTESEWQTLFNNYSGIAFAASPLKYSGYSGFTALLTGTIPQNTILHFNNFASFYWTSTSHGTYKAWAHGFNDPDPSASTYPASRQDAFSVRCVKD